MFWPEFLFAHKRERERETERERDRARDRQTDRQRETDRVNYILIFKKAMFWAFCWPRHRRCRDGRRKKQSYAVCIR